MTDRAAFQAEVRRLAQAVVDAVDPSEPAYGLWSYCFGKVTEPDCREAHPLWLIWGGLTDSLDHLDEDEEVPSDVAARIRRAASEWLDLPDDADSRTTYFDHWIYDELGQERPALS